MCESEAGVRIRLHIGGCMRGRGSGKGGAQSEFEPSSSLNSTSNRRPGCRNRRVLVEEFKFEFVKEANPASNTQTNPKEVKPSATETLMK